MDSESTAWKQQPQHTREAVEYHLIEAYLRVCAAKTSAHEFGLTALSGELCLNDDALGMAINTLRDEGGAQKWRECTPLNRERVYASLQLRAREIHKDFLVLQGLELLQGRLLKLIDAFVAAEKLLREVAGE